MANQAKFSRSCKCGNVDFYSVSDREAAFQKAREEIVKSVCSKCGNKNIYSLVPLNFEIDESILIEWSLNDQLYFDDYGYEDYVISSLPLDIILTALDNDNTNDVKKGILVSSLFILLDETMKVNENKSNNLILELKKRKNLIEYYFNYIQVKNNQELFNLINER